MTTQQYLANGIDAGRRVPDRDHMWLREMELSLASTRSDGERRRAVRRLLGR